MDIPQSQDTFEVNTAVDFFLNSNQYLTSFGVDTIKAAQIKGEPLINLESELEFTKSAIINSRMESLTI